MSYVGIPFVDGGRTIDGADWWGLVRLVLAREHGVIVPEYGEVGADEILQIGRLMKAATDDDPSWRKVSDEARRAGDCAVMRRHTDTGKIPFHIGIMLDTKRLLHTEKWAESHTVMLKDPTVANRILGFFRHRDMP